MLLIAARAICPISSGAGVRTTAAVAASPGAGAGAAAAGAGVRNCAAMIYAAASTIMATAATASAATRISDRLDMAPSYSLQSSLSENILRENT